MVSKLSGLTSRLRVASLGNETVVRSYIAHYLYQDFLPYSFDVTEHTLTTTNSHRQQQQHACVDLSLTRTGSLRGNSSPVRSSHT